MGQNESKKGRAGGFFRLIWAGVILMVTGCVEPVSPGGGRLPGRPEMGQVKTEYNTPVQPTPWEKGQKQMRASVIVIDAGHGGKDPGALARRKGDLPEKTINLLIANKLAEELEKYGARVILTRREDRFIELLDRAEISNVQEADLFISIHADTAPSESANGLAIYLENNARARTERK